MACASEPGDAHLLSDLAIALVSSGDPSTAVKIAEHAVRARGTDARAWYVLGLSRRTAGTPRAEFVAGFERAAELGFQPAMVVLADLHWADGRLDAAVEILKPVLDVGQRTIMATQTLAIVYQAIGETERARKLGEPFFDRPVTSSAIALGLAWIAIDSGRFAKAVDLLGGALRTLHASEIDDPTIRARLTNLRKQAQDFAAMATTIVDLGDDVGLPVHKGTLQTIGMVARRMERPVLAARAFEKLLLADGANVSEQETDFYEGSLAILEAGAEPGSDVAAARTRAIEWLGQLVAMLGSDSGSSVSEHSAQRKIFVRTMLCALRMHPRLQWLHPAAAAASQPSSLPSTDPNRVSKQTAELWLRIDALWREVTKS